MSTVVCSSNSPIFTLPEKTTAYIMPNKYNYKLTIEQLMEKDFEKISFSKEDFYDLLAGIVSPDYLIELEYDRIPSMSNLGWYYRDEDTEFCVIEYCLPEYTKDNVKSVYKGNFYRWGTKVEQVSLDELVSQEY